MAASAVVLVVVLLLSAHVNAERLPASRDLHRAVRHAAADPRRARPPGTMAARTTASLAGTWAGAVAAATVTAAKHLLAPTIILPVPGWPVVSLRLEHARPRPIPPSFLGLSTEYWTMPHYAGDRWLLTRVIDRLRLPRQRFTLRIGGDSADVSWWSPGRQAAPPWAYRVTPRWLAETARLVRDAHLHVLLDLNLVDRSPMREALWARAFVRHMPRGSVQAIAIGNEPDLYPVQGGLGELSTVRPERVTRYFAWASDYTPATYDTQFSIYARALAQAGVRVPLAGPELSDPTQTEWLPGLIDQERPRLAFVSAHRYPLSACETDRSASDYPTVWRLLAERASAGLAQSVTAAILLSHQAGLPFRLTEFNSVTCGGARSVSGTFANALWAPDALFSLMRVGVDGVDVHVRARAVNAPFFVSRHGLAIEPIFLGLVMFQRTLSGGGQLLATRMRAADRTHLKAWAVAARRTIRVLLINKGDRGANVHLHLPGRAPALVQRLLARSPTARSGVTLAGQSLTPSGHWRGPFTSQTVTHDARGYDIAVPRDSAALVTLRTR